MTEPTNVGAMADAFTAPFVANRQMPTCQECGDKWYEAPHPFKADRTIKVRIPCNHQATELAKAEALEDRKRGHGDWASRYRHMRHGIDGARRLSDFDGRPCWVRGLKVARAFVAGWDGRYGTPLERMRGLTFFGDLGVGKTSLAYAIGRELDAVCYRVAALTEDELVRQMRIDVDRNRPEEFSGRAFDGAVSADLLILDEVGRRKQSEWGASELFTVLQRRYERKRSTILTLNHLVETVDGKPVTYRQALTAHYHRCLTAGGMDSGQAYSDIARLFSRLDEVNHDVEFRGADQRRSDRTEGRAQA